MAFGWSTQCFVRDGLESLKVKGVLKGVRRIWQRKGNRAGFLARMIASGCSAAPRSLCGCKGSSEGRLLLASRSMPSV